MIWAGTYGYWGSEHDRDGDDEGRAAVWSISPPGMRAHAHSSAGGAALAHQVILGLGPPPHRREFADLPLRVLAHSGRGPQLMVEARLHALDLVFARAQLIPRPGVRPRRTTRARAHARVITSVLALAAVVAEPGRSRAATGARHAQLKERPANLQEQHVRVSVVVRQNNGLDGASHAVRVVLVLDAHHARLHGRVLLWLHAFLIERVVGQRVPKVRARCREGGSRPRRRFPRDIMSHARTHKRTETATARRCTAA